MALHPLFVDVRCYSHAHVVQANSIKIDAR